MELRTDRLKLKDVFPERAKKYAQKLHIKSDDIEFVRKGISIDPTEIKIDEGERAAIRLITTPRLDRDGEILIPDGAILDDFRQSPSVFYGHDYQKLPIGHDQWIKPSKKGILAKTLYANHQFAEDVFQCVKGGHLNSNSAGFIPVERVLMHDKEFGSWVDALEKDYGVPRDEAKKANCIYTKWILLEHSDVGVASNAQSLNVAVSKGELIIESKQLKRDMGIEEPESKLDVSKIMVPISADMKVGVQVEMEVNGKKTGKVFFPIEEVQGPLAQITQEESLLQDTVQTEPLLQDKAEIVTKPETTENYIRIPVSTGHDGHRIRTITISASEGIKALYCGTCKEIVTYLFDVNKFTMAEAQAWVDKHKDYQPDETETKEQPDITAMFDHLNEHIDSLTQTMESLKPLLTPVIEPSKDIITIDSVPDVLDIEPTPAPKAEPKSQNLTPDEIEAAITSAVARLDIKQILNEGIKLHLDKLRGRIR